VKVATDVIGRRRSRHSSGPEQPPPPHPENTEFSPARDQFTTVPTFEGLAADRPASHAARAEVRPCRAEPFLVTVNVSLRIASSRHVTEPFTVSRQSPVPMQPPPLQPEKSIAGRRQPSI